MERRLCQALEDLPRLHNGEPDYLLRGANLSSLMDSLTTNEMRQLKSFFSTTTLHRDIVADLPVELIVLVSDSLDICDVLACLTISRTWRAKFMSDQVMFAIAERSFPSLAFARLDANDGAETVQKNLASSVVDALCASGRRIDQRFRSHFANRYKWKDPYFHADPNVYSRLHYDFENVQRYGLLYRGPLVGEMQRPIYSHGRLAWHAGDHVLVVDSFVTQCRQIFNAVNGHMISPYLHLGAFGDRLLVGTMNNHLCAWELETGRYERVSLPSRGECFASIGNMVTVVTGTQQLFLWEFGGPLLQIDLPLPTPGIGPRRIRMAMHPRSDGTLFIGTGDASLLPSPSLNFTIYEIKQRKVVNTYSVAIPGDERSTRARYLTLNMEFKEANSYGVYNLAQFPFNDFSTPRGVLDKVVCVTFDIYHKRFSTQSFDVDLGNSDPAHYCAGQLWNDQFHIVKQFEAGDHIVHQSGPSSHDYQKLKIDDGTVGRLSIVTGDDDFLVAIGRDGYQVWSYSSDLTRNVLSRFDKTQPASKFLPEGPSGLLPS